MNSITREWWARLRFAHPTHIYLLRSEFSLARSEQPVRQKLPQATDIGKFQRNLERHDIAQMRRRFRRSMQPRKILLRCHQRQAVATGIGDQALDLAVRKPMMVGKSSFPHHLDMASAQCPKKASGVADARKGEHALAAELRKRRRVGLEMR